jgi:hypothetical protein
VNVDLDNARIGRHADDVEARVVRWCIAFDMHGQTGFLGSGFRNRQQFKIVVHRLRRRHEYAEPSITRFDGYGGADDTIDIAACRLLNLVGVRRVSGEAGACLSPAIGSRLGLICPSEIRQWPALNGWVGRQYVRIACRWNVRQGTQWQAVANRAIAWDEEQMPTAQSPPLRNPTLFRRLGLPPLDRQGVARRLSQAMVKHPRNAVTLLRVFQLGVFRRDVLRQISFADNPFRRIFKGWQHVVGVNF